ncbi:lectin-like protein, partial [Salmonella sp. s54395]|uniref:lectin-like protein n=1 Tax=Salmonella sp. s54395 TaxID=3159664 RepID=UPI00397F826E
MSYYDALNFCRLFSTEEHLRGFADLVSIHSLDEQEFVYHFWQSFREQDNRPNRPALWIGLTDDVNGQYEWSDRTPFNFSHFDV